jgi:trehalose 6-phosphate phosphatase
MTMAKRPRATQPAPASEADRVARPLRSDAGEAALAQLAARRPLLAFDFDGTLAPIVNRPEDARLPEATADRLQRLMALTPVAIVTGRRIADARQRLGFEPHHLLGNHGAEDEHADPGDALAPHADPQYRKALGHLDAARPDLHAAGVRIEDKGASIALHYRQADDIARAEAVIDALLGLLGDDIKTFGGKMVVNLSPAGSPDKADAMHTLLRRSGAGSALFAGDDLNDEPVFERAPADWLTLRVGHTMPDSRARWTIDGPEDMVWVLDRLLTLLPKG